MQSKNSTRKQRILEYMGKPVHVVVDRPIGYVHGDIIYPINYGYIPGLLAGDGEEQDAYILGVNEPLTEFDGQVVAAVCRKNDCEDKLVVAPVGTVYHQGQIAEAVHFQEQYFTSTIDALFRKSCGVIPFRQNGDKREFLILLQTNSCWSFPKGHMEAGETEIQTAKRELFEETGITAKLDTCRCVAIEYPISDYARKEVIFYLGEVAGEPKVQKSEIETYKWVAFQELKDYIFPNAFEACRELLKEW